MQTTYLVCRLSVTPGSSAAYSRNSLFRRGRWCDIFVNSSTN